MNPVQLPVRWYCILTVVSSPKNPQNRRWKSRHALSVLCSYCGGDSLDVCCGWTRNTENTFISWKERKKKTNLINFQKTNEGAHLVSRTSSDTARASQSGWRFLRSRRTRNACSSWRRDRSTSWGRIWHRFLPLWEAGRCWQPKRVLRRKTLTNVGGQRAGMACESI